MVVQVLGALTLITDINKQRVIIRSLHTAGARGSCKQAPSNLGSFCLCQKHIYAFKVCVAACCPLGEAPVHGG